jgi:hypothetical protein
MGDGTNLDELDPGAILKRLAPLFADSHGSLRDLHALLLRAPQRLAHPVRLAVVGQVSKGKSTLVNALLGERRAVTGALETTFQINEFRYRTKAAARAHYRSGAAGFERVKEVSLGELAGLTVRGAGHRAGQRDLLRVVVDLPKRLLKSFELIDTPGLYSVYGEDSERTQALLAATDASAGELEHADAILYLFSRELGRADTDVVSRFLGGGASYAIGATRAVGVVSKCDMIWPPGKGSAGYNPIEEVGRARIERYMADEPEIGRLFYDIVPVAALVAEGAQTIPSEWFNWLQALAALEPGALLKVLRYRSVFTSETLPGISLPAQQRGELDRRLGPWGILLSCRYLRDGCPEKQVRRQLVRDSGILHVRNLTRSHFGKQASLIKLDRILSAIREAASISSAQSISADTEDAVAQVRSAVEAITDRQPGLWAMEVLRLITQGRVRFSPSDEHRLTRLTAPGGSCAARLALPDTATVAQLPAAAAAEVAYWQRRDSDIAYAEPEAREAVRLLLRTAEHIRHQITVAEDMLRQADRLKAKAQLLLDGW